jgi:hypothetical protein
LNFIGFLFFVMVRTLHVSGWNAINHDVSHFSSLSRSDYSSTVWDPHQQQDKQRLERIQRRAARYVTNRYHNTSYVSDMLDQLLKASRLGAPTLASFRAFQSLVVLG